MNVAQSNRCDAPVALASRAVGWLSMLLRRVAATGRQNYAAVALAWPGLWKESQDMTNRNLVREYIEGELNLDPLAELEAKDRRRKGDAIVALLGILEKVKGLSGAKSRYGSIPAMDN